jgi:ADP-heptose:LPS heptosyltransferase
MQNPKTILISRTDSIGDVVLTLPMAGVLKKYFPESRIIFLGQNYTREVVQLSKYVDEFIDWKTFSSFEKSKQISELRKKNIDTVVHVFPNKQIAVLMKKVGVANRIGTSHRIYHWLNCNRFSHFSRKNSNLHESQLNLKLLKPLGINENFDLSQISEFYGFECKYPLPEGFKSLITNTKYNIILHAKSKGSAREWGLDNFQNLIKLLNPEFYNVFLTGTEEEGKLFREKLSEPFPHVQDLSGKMTLAELVSFINSADALVAASTGPLHIAASLSKLAIGIYPPIRPMHPGRWQPIGKNVKIFVNNNECNQCRKSSICKCMTDISPKMVLQLLDNNLKTLFPNL